MKYIFRNIKSFFIDDTLVFFLTIVTISISCFMINFSYAVYQNYEMKKESSKEEQDYIVLLGDYEFERQIVHPAGQFKYLDYEGKAATIGMVEKFGKELEQEVWKHIDVVFVHASYFNYELIETFSFDKDGFTVCEEQLNNHSYEHIVSGRYFTEEEFKNGDKVAIIFDEFVNSGQLPISQEMEYSDTHIKIGDELYEIIGVHREYLDQPIIPITSLPKDTIIDGYIHIYFDKNIDLYIYNQICEASDKVFGDMFTVQPVELPDIDTIRLYNTIIIIVAIISLIAAINFTILYRYILKKRNVQLSYMRMCGLSYSKAMIIYLGECILLTLPVYTVVTFIYAKYLLPKLSNMYEYGFYRYNSFVYLSLAGIYFGVSLIVILVTLVSQMKRDRIVV
ncbi:MAG: ABC transporter permease [Lachnospiraceae bacterium]|nr:ABC transporter permease [Lachnospiraceae bacterium]